jgi:hypothetical protein
MNKTGNQKIKKLIKLLDNPLKSGVHILIMNEEEILIEYNGRAYTHNSIKISNSIINIIPQS